MTSDILKEWEEKSEAMIHWAVKAKDNPDDGPYPSMLKLIKAYRVMDEALKFYANPNEYEFESIKITKKAIEAKAQAEKILKSEK